MVGYISKKIISIVMVGICFFPSLACAEEKEVPKKVVCKEHSKPIVGSKGETYRGEGIILKILPGRLGVSVKQYKNEALQTPMMVINYEVADDKLLNGLDGEDEMRYEFYEDEGRRVISNVGGKI